MCFFNFSFAFVSASLHLGYFGVLSFCFFKGNVQNVSQPVFEGHTHMHAHTCCTNRMRTKKPGCYWKLLRIQTRVDKTTLIKVKLKVVVRETESQRKKTRLQLQLSIREVKHKATRIYTAVFALLPPSENIVSLIVFVSLCWTCDELVTRPEQNPAFTPRQQGEAAAPPWPCVQVKWRPKMNEWIRQWQSVLHQAEEDIGAEFKYLGNIIWETSYS